MRFLTTRFILGALIPAVMTAAIPAEPAIVETGNAASPLPTTLRIMTRTFSQQTHSTDYPLPTMTPSSEPPPYSTDDEVYGIHAEIQSLLELEQQALALQFQIDARKQVLAGRLRQHREQASLKELLAQCDGLVCAAKVIAQRICDKIGISTEPSLAYARLEQQQVLLPNSNDTQSTAPPGKNDDSALPSHRPSAVNESTSNSNALPSLVNVTTPWSALVSVLEVIASVLGLAALFGFIRRRFFTSDRSRADRAADREERLTARAYRRAARRAEVRRRWTEMWQSVNCFGGGRDAEYRVGAMPVPSDASRYEGYRRHADRHHERRAGMLPFRTSSRRNNAYVPTSDYDEKRALIVQDAFLEEQRADPAIAEKGQAMEAEIRELRHAHDMVRNLISRPSHVVATHAETTLRIDTSPHIDRDLTPKPPFMNGASIIPSHIAPITTITATASVIAALTPVTRSRASSTTLPPSYRSESLPDYTSRPGGTNPRTSHTFDDNTSDDDERSLLPTTSTNPYRTRGRGRRSQQHGTSYPHHNDDAIFSLSYPSDDEGEIPPSPSISTSSSQFFPHSESTLPPFSPDMMSRQRSRSLVLTTPASSILETSTRPSGETLRMSEDFERRSRSCERRQ